MAISASLSSSLAPKLHGSPAFPSKRAALPTFAHNPRPPTGSRALRARSAKVAPRAVAVGEDLPADYAEWLPEADPSKRRRAGVLLHPTSFRGPYGIGDLGGEAFRFLDWLHASGCSVWQVLPLVPPARKPYDGGSPYSGQDANCGNILLISLEELVKEGLLEKDELPDAIDADSVNYSIVAELKDPLIAKRYYHCL
ncbi:hypothetical protein BT93_L5214 [Corymbia citriodora subsp. variegata]|uniref:4-alpha-glucanotransferase n=1 Tax=Corymbia citriodora subsp. variegata TaxID=360336 RepID=A0A8T0CV31_CORYI|nr:hypothetical protein BT93_L5214 [Corymbia citriodora subsp. variegata]